MGYSRVSAQDQSTNLQLDALAKTGDVRGFSESPPRPAGPPRAGLRFRRHAPGRHPRVWRLDMLTRSLKQLIETVEFVDGEGIGFLDLQPGGSRKSLPRRTKRVPKPLMSPRRPRESEYNHWIIMEPVRGFEPRTY